MTETKTLQFRMETFNTFNEVNLAPPQGNAVGAYTALGGGTTTTITSPNFMQILAAGPSREIQFALKLLF